MNARRAAIAARDAVLGALPPVRASLAVYDDVFPNLLTAFRVAEFNAYLERWPTAVVNSSNWFPTASGHVGFTAAYREYARLYPHLARRVVRRSRRVAASHAYCVFLHNAAENVERFEEHRWPFLFTLYPGGGMEMSDACAARIERVTSSPMFRGMILTQGVTERWLKEQGVVDMARTHMIWGVVLPDAPEVERTWWPEKPTLDVVFVAHKYTPGGVDKGYDLFLQAARELASAQPAARFHVVGDWSPADQPVDGIEDRVRFHGLLASPDLHRLFQSMDVIVSPSRPFALHRQFDGFPLGSAVEAGLRGVVVIATDSMDEGGPFAEGELLVVQPDAQEIAGSLCALASDPERLVRTASAGQTAFRRAYGRQAQIAPRIGLLEQLMSSD